ncbi:MAG TPA: NUDIX hydrolase [Solirubrobacteraceae bacterium]|nr:NUDIX hydrolase [Solirubrobacteraceae bacterium]
MHTAGDSQRPAPSPQGEPGQAYNAGPPTPPRQAASVILLRNPGRADRVVGAADPVGAANPVGAAGGGASSPEGDRLEVLLVRRTPKARFMGGVWVFPGGAVDAGEGDGDDAHRAAALRELREEAGIAIDDPAALVKFSRWVTPAQVQIRFDTHFFLAELPNGQEPRIDGEECVDLGWFAPQAALEANRTGQIELVFPTIKHLEQLSEFSSVQELLDHARGREVQPVEPRVLIEGEVARVVLPGEPGY